MSVHLQHNSKVGPLKLNLKKIKDQGVFLPLIFHNFDNFKQNFAQITLCSSAVLNKSLMHIIVFTVNMTLFVISHLNVVFTVLKTFFATLPYP